MKDFLQLIAQAKKIINLTRASILFNSLPPSNSDRPQNDQTPLPLHFPPVARPVLSIPCRSRVYLVGCCIQSSIGGRLRPRRILFFIFFAPSFDGQNDLTASSPIVITLRSLPPNHILTFRPTFGRLLRPPIQQSHRNPRP